MPTLTAIFRSNDSTHSNLGEGVRSRAESERILRAVGRHLNWRSGLMVPEAVVNYKTGQKASWGDYEMTADYLADIMWVTASNYATEMEIKISLSDWRADAAKGKWRGMPDWIARFIYVVPEALGVPDFVPEFAGVWHVIADRNYGEHIRVVRAPTRRGKQKVPPEVTARWLQNLYCRYWHQKLYTNHRALPKETHDPTLSER